MYSAKEFCKIKASFYKDLSHSHVEMIGRNGAGNNPMVGMTVAVAVAIEEASK